MPTFSTHRLAQQIRDTQGNRYTCELIHQQLDSQLHPTILYHAEFQGLHRKQYYDVSLAAYLLFAEKLSAELTVYEPFTEQYFFVPYKGKGSSFQTTRNVLAQLLLERPNEEINIPISWRITKTESGYFRNFYVRSCYPGKSLFYRLCNKIGYKLVSLRVPA